MQFYRGTASASEPETQAVVNLLSTIFNLKIAINLESFRNEIMIPYSYMATYLIEREDQYWWYSNLQRDTDSFITRLGIHNVLQSRINVGDPIDWFLGTRHVHSI